MGTYHDATSIPFSSKTKKRAEWRDTSVLRSKTLAQGEFISPEQVQLPLGRSGQSPRSPKKNTTRWVVFFFGGLEGDRTLDLTDANRTLSQLSYEPILEQGKNPAPMIIHTFCQIASAFIR